MSNLNKGTPRIVDSCFEISVLPTPVGPVNRKEPIVLFSSLKPTRESLIAFDNTFIALS